MMQSLDHQKAVVLVFGMEGCDACERYIPRLLNEAQALASQGYPFIVGGGGTQIPNNAIPILVFDAASPDVGVQKLADRFAVSATPTTVIACRGPGSFKVEGGLADNQISWVLMMAVEAANR